MGRSVSKKAREDKSKETRSYAQIVNYEDVEQLSDHFMTAFYYIRLNTNTVEGLARASIGIYVENKTPVKLKVYHYAAMWLIELLTKQQEECLGIEVRDLLHWKHPVFELDRFSETVLNPLLALKLITYNSISNQHRSTRIIKITREGGEFLDKMKPSRHDAVRSLIGLFGVDKDNFSTFRSKLEKLSETAWTELKKDGRVWSRKKPR